MYARDIKNPVMHEVKNPSYQEYDDIQDKYKENLIVMTNCNWRESPLRLLGGIVRYYGNDKEKILDKWQELGDIEEYGECFYTTLMTAKGVYMNYDKA